MPIRGGDKKQYAPQIPDLLVNIAHSHQILPLRAQSSTSASLDTFCRSCGFCHSSFEFFLLVTRRSGLSSSCTIVAISKLALPALRLRSCVETGPTLPNK